ncbi:MULTISPECIES: Uma2 family endonuclease [unclassified Coleofasciculus]|uniref:Uma2 family endonuclease n=1 Tax=unclassified Coleofasciculus TaxID=2692782 RepID=UPI00187E306E|nr:MULTISPECIES: Uma2 family endonuclease [unclassified Coleofasciculus]MBE9127369.1 Uma2 family endonuclease [Coleofasciculus sp. LEGE 07081]MBE9147365.1 Uma2 family endonuclease [Coleofasciculus sp. LEGE 07092]
MTTKPLDKPTTQQFIHTGMNWQQFKLLQESFADSPGIRLGYYKEEVEILRVSPDCESISRMITALLVQYFLEKELEFNPLGSCTQEKEELEVSAQADESFAIGSFSATRPDLSIEVIFTSGSSRKLTRYQALGVPEVWLWEDGVFRLYHLRKSEYERIERSEVLPQLDINLLSRCLMMASKIEALREFTRGLRRGEG